MKNKIIIGFILCLFCFLLTSCGGFIDSENLVITSIQTQSLEDGTTMVIITYDDEEIEPQIFYIPKGSDGTGIKDIYYSLSEDGKYTTVDIYYTDNIKSPVTFNVPSGVSIESITSKTDEETGDTLITVNYNNGKSSEPIRIEKGEQGEKGTSIIGIDHKYNSETGMVEVKFQYSDGTESSIFNVPQGKTGNGIKDIISYEDDEHYIINIIYTDAAMGEKELKFSKPAKANTWHRTEDEPKESLGMVGDYCFDVFHNDIYEKTENGWNIIIDMDYVEQTFTVKFDLNGEGAELVPNHNYQKEYKIIAGGCFATSNVSLPIPYRTGYDFAGWYATPSPLPYVSGTFTDMTTVNSDITLYAKWVAISE